MTEAEIENLISYTGMFLNHVHVVQQSFHLLPDKNHYGTCINYVDLQESRDGFLNELINTISEWVYTQEEAQRILQELINEGRPPLNANAALQTHIFQKFRKRGDDGEYFLNGQLGELLLFNFLQ